MTYTFPVIITQDDDGTYVARVPTLYGCHTQAKNLKTLHKRMQEVISLCLEVERSKHRSITQPKFVALQHVEVRL